MRSQTRAGFTLVELMVAMALTMFIMVILSQAFVIALDTFVGLKAIGDMQGNLRVAKVLLTDDLSNDHFPGNVRLSELSQQPRAGFFAVLQGSTVADATAGTAQTGPYVREGVDSNLSLAFSNNGFPSFRATNHVLYMTVKRKGNRPENFFTTALALPSAQPFFNQQTSYTMPANDLASATYADPGFFNSQWAEVMYYLERTGSTEEPNNPSSTLGMPLFALKRAQFVMVTDSTNLNLPTPVVPASSFSTFEGVSCNINPAGTALTFYSPTDAAQDKAQPNGFRVQSSLNTLVDTSGALVNPFPQRIASVATLVVPNVMSFHIQIMRIGTVNGVPVNDIAFIDVPAISSGPTVYDTALFGAPTYPAAAATGLKGIQISLRVFEYKTRQTRQMTIVQDL